MRRVTAYMDLNITINHDFFHCSLGFSFSSNLSFGEAKSKPSQEICLHAVYVKHMILNWTIAVIQWILELFSPSQLPPSIAPPLLYPSSPFPKYFQPLLICPFNIDSLTFSNVNCLLPLHHLHFIPLPPSSPNTSVSSYQDCNSVTVIQ